MKKYMPILAIGILLISVLSAAATTINNNDLPTINIQFSAPIIKENNNYINIEIPQTNSILLQENKPVLPSYIETIYLPLGTKINDISCQPKHIESTILTKYIEPAPPAVRGDFQTRFNDKKAIPAAYTIDPYPNTWFRYNIGCGIIDNQRQIIVKIQVFPVQYYPETNMIKWSENFDIVLDYQIPEEPVTFRDQYDFVIIGPSSYSDELAPLVSHKNSRGIDTLFVSLNDIYSGTHFPVNGRDDPEKIKYFIKSAIENWSIDFVLLAGGSAQVPIRETHIYVQNHNDNEVFASDLYYADIYDGVGGFSSWDTNGNDVFGEHNWNGNDDDLDLYPDIHLGRIACISGNQVTTCVNKITTYENNEAYAQDWFTDIVVIGGDHAPGDTHKVDEGEYVNQVIIDLMDGFAPEKIWDTNGRLSGALPTGIQEITNTINDGCGFIDLSGHGNTDRWATHPHEDVSRWIPTPVGSYLNNPHVSSLSNGNKLPIVIIGACSTCKFNKDTDCFGWMFISDTNGGGIAAIGAAGLDYFYLGTYVAQDGFEKLCIDLFEEYADGAMTFGEMWSGALTDYITPSMDDIDFKTVEELEPFGDPTLAIRSDSSPPNKPTKPSGSTNGKAGTTYTYTTGATDPEGNQIYYRFDWGDNTTSNWEGPFSSGSSGSASHAWPDEGSYVIKVIAKDEHGSISVWSDLLSISMPMINAPINRFPLLHQLLIQFPNAFPVLRALMEI